MRLSMDRGNTLQKLAPYAQMFVEAMSTEKTLLGTSFSALSLELLTTTSDRENAKSIA